MIHSQAVWDGMQHKYNTTVAIYEIFVLHQRFFCA